MRQENPDLKAAAQRQAYRADQTLELATICYGSLRHYVLGFLVARLSTSKLSDYELGFRKRVRLQAESARHDDTLLDASFESVAGVEPESDLVPPTEVSGDDFARSLSEVTKVPMVSLEEEQSVFRSADNLVTRSPFSKGVDDKDRGFTIRLLAVHDPECHAASVRVVHDIYGNRLALFSV